MSTISERLAELGLSANPFSRDTPLESLFPGGMRRASLDQLQLLVRESSDIIALIGADGSGKSILADFYARRSDRDQIVARTRASMLTSPAQLLQEMFKAFVLDFPPQASLGELKAVLLAYFKAVQDKSRSVVLIVDDAHELGDDAFNLLTKLALTENPGNTFHLILVGQIALLDMLDYTCPQKHGSNQFTSIRLPEFSLEETRNYLRYRLNAVGFNDQDPARALPFSNRQVEKIYKLSEGIPARINNIAGDILLSRGSVLSVFTEYLQKVSMPPKYMYAAGALLFILVLAFLVGGGDTSDDAQVAQRQIVLPVPSSVPNSEETSEEALIVSEHVRESTDSPFADAAVASVIEEPAEQASVPESPAPSSPAVAASAPAAPEPVPALAVAPTAVTATPVTPAPATPAPAPISTAAVAVASTPAPAPIPAPASQAQATGIGQGRQVLALPSNQFTVQLLGAASRANVEAFVQRHQSAPLYWFVSENQGRPWYVVIHGSYPSRAAAQTAANAFSGELGRLQPWIRSLSAVQQDVALNN